MDKPVCILKSRHFAHDPGVAANGGALNAAMLVSALVRAGVPVEVFTGRQEGEPASLHERGLTIHRLDYDRSSCRNVFERDLDDGRAFAEALLNHPRFDPRRFRVLHTHHWSAAIGLPAILDESIRWIHTPHLLAFEKSLFAADSCPVELLDDERDILRRANIVVALSRHERDVLTRRLAVSECKVAVVPNGVSDFFFRKAVRADDVRRLDIQVMLTGRICRQKGIDILLDALEALAMSLDVPVQTALIGGSYGEPEYESYLRERIRSTRALQGVTLKGHVEHRRVAAYLADADIYVQPSRYETQGVALLEAMAAGKPVVATSLPAVLEYVRPHTNGLVFAGDGDTHVLRSHVAALALEPSLRRSLGMQARATARRFRWSTTIDRMWSLYFDGVEAVYSRAMFV